jgi:hypothetical protein
MREVFVWSEEVFPVYQFETTDHPFFYDYSTTVTVEQLAMWREIRDRYEDMQHELRRLACIETNHESLGCGCNPDEYEPERD